MRNPIQIGTGLGSAAKGGKLNIIVEKPLFPC